MADQTPPPNSPQAPDPAVRDAADMLRKLVDIANIQLDLTKATNVLLSAQVKGTPEQQPGGAGSGGRTAGGGGPGDGSVASALDAVFAKHFGKESKGIDPQRGLARYAGKALGRAVKGGRAGRFAKAGGKIARGLGRTVGSAAESVGLAEAGTAARAAAMLGPVGVAIGAVVGSVVAVGVAFKKAYDAVDKYTENQFAAAAKLSEVSGQVAYVMAEREVGQIGRDITRGERTAGTLGQLQKSEAERKDQENELGVFFDNAVNKVLSWGNDVATPVLECLNYLIKLGQELPWIGDEIKKLRNEKAGEEAPQGLGQINDDVSKMLDREAAAGRSLMDAAKSAAAMARGGTAAPSGAMGGGRL